MTNPLGVRLSSFSMTEDVQLPEILDEAAIIGFNRHQKLMSPATRELVLKSRQTEIQAFSEDRGLDAHVVGMVCEVAMRTGRVPDLRQYGFAGDEAIAVKHFVAGEILNLAVEDIEQMERDALSEGKKLHPEMHKHTNTDKFKAHVGDPKDEKKPFHKGKGLRAGVSFDKERGFLSEVSPKGWKGTVEKMKAHPEIDNPWALAHHMKNKGAKPRYTEPKSGEEPKRKEEATMLGPDPVNEGTTAGGVSNPLGMGSAFIERPRQLFSINQWEKTKEENKAINADPWIGVDMQHQSGYTLDQILSMKPDQTAVTEGANPVPTLATRLEEGSGLEGKGKKGGTKLAKDLKFSKKKITSPAEDPPGDFDTASGGTSSGDTDTHGRLKEMTFSKEHGFVIEMKGGELTKKQKSPKNKAKWAKMSPEQKKAWGAATKSKPFHKK
jgi:hypothetical protein